MAREFKEVAKFKTDKAKYDENYDRIFGGKVADKDDKNTEKVSGINEEISELKPCPFCGNMAVADLTNGVPSITCQTSSCVFMHDFESPWLDNLVEKWNKRPTR